MAYKIVIDLTESQMRRFERVNKLMTEYGNYKADVSDTATSAAIEGLDKLESVFLKLTQGERHENN